MISTQPSSFLSSKLLLCHWCRALSESARHGSSNDIKSSCCAGAATRGGFYCCPSSIEQEFPATCQRCNFLRNPDFPSGMIDVFLRLMVQSRQQKLTSLIAA